MRYWPLSDSAPCTANVRIRVKRRHLLNLRAGVDWRREPRFLLNAAWILITQMFEA